MEEKILYFEKSGVENTKKTLKLSKERALKRNIKHVVLASTRGYTAEKALKIFDRTDIHLVAIPHQYGSMEGDLFDNEIKKSFEHAGHEVYFSTMLFARFWGASNVTSLISNTLYRFCQGMKVCVEITLMAANGGKIPTGQDIVAIAGTDIGADTAIVIQASTSFKFKDLQIKEIICKPFYSLPYTPDVIKERVEKLRARRK